MSSGGGDNRKAWQIFGGLAVAGVAAYATIISLWKRDTKRCKQRLATAAGECKAAADAAAARAKALAEFEARPLHEGAHIESMSTIVLLAEAHRRGWKSKTLHLPLKVSLVFARLPDGSVEEIVIRNSRCEAINGVGALVADDKHFTLAMARHYGMPMPVTQLLRAKDSLAAAQAFMAEHQLVVVKPVDQGHGDGVTAWISTDAQLQAALAHARKFSADVLLQKHHRESDHRLLIVGFKLVAAVKRVPAHVVGDGKSTIQQLLAVKNADPRRGPGHTQLLSTIPVEDVPAFLAGPAGGGRTMQTVPAAGEYVTVLGAANVSRGGESHDVTDAVHPTIAALCERFARVAGMGVCGCDVLVSDISQPADVVKPVFLELNAGPGLRLHTYPNVGQPRAVSAAIWDYVVAQRLHQRSFPYRPSVAKAEITPPPESMAASVAAAAAAGAGAGAKSGTDVKHSGK